MPYLANCMNPNSVKVTGTFSITSWGKMASIIAVTSDHMTKINFGRLLTFEANVFKGWGTQTRYFESRVFFDHECKDDCVERYH